MTSLPRVNSMNHMFTIKPLIFKQPFSPNNVKNCCV